MNIVKGSDPQSFHVLTEKRLAEGIGQDKNAYYIGRKQASKDDVKKSI